MKMTLKTIRKELLLGRIRLTNHSKVRLFKRGYTKSDVMLVIMQGDVHEYQQRKGKLCTVLIGKDTDGNPLAVVIGIDTLHYQRLSVVTVFPPIDRGRFKKVI